MAETAPASRSSSRFAPEASPSAPRYAPEDPTLPKPWKGLVDGSTGYLYFWNPDTNVTQYERPKGPTSRARSPTHTKSSAPISSSVQIHHSSHGHLGSSRMDEDVRHNGDISGRPKLAAIPGGRSHQGSRGGSGHIDDVPNGSGSGVNGGRGHSSHVSKSSAKPHGSDVGSNISSESYRRQHEITVNGEDVPPPFTSFESTGFPSEILREVHNAGFSAPTPIQAQTWPVALQSRDIVAIAKTGSGKTLGYLIPGFIHLKRCRNNPQLGPTVLVLSPTRELATQIQVEAVKFSKSSRIACTCLYGGAPKGPQLRDLERGTDIVVATPGRLNDILEMRKISLRQVSYLVLDEADRMLDMGFEPQIRKIVQEIPPRRQTLMYTATWPKEVRKIAADLLVNPIQVNIGSVDELVANKSITQYIEVVTPMEKNRRLEQILRSQEPGAKVIVFCSTKKMCDQLTRTITRQFGAAAIHGDKSQGERDYVLNQFRTGKSPILVATDVAARGLDVKDIRVVINYDFPTGIEDYVHRIGRTGRAGATGIAYTFFCEQDAKYASDLIKVLEGANQRVPPQIRDMASRGGGMGRIRNRWASGPGGRDGGRGGRNDSSFGGRGGRGFPPSSGRSERGGYGGRGHDLEPRERYGRGYVDAPNVDLHDRYQKGNFGQDNDRRIGDRDRVRGRSQSPVKGSGWGYPRSRSRSRSWNRDHSRSRSRSRSYDRYDGPAKVLRKHSPVARRNGSPPPLGPRRNASPPAIGPRRHGSPPPLGPRRNGSPPAIGPRRHGSPPALGARRNGSPPAIGPRRHGSPPAIGPRRHGSPPAIGARRISSPPPTGPRKNSSPPPPGPRRNNSPHPPGPRRNNSPPPGTRRNSSPPPPGTRRNNSPHRSIELGRSPPPPSRGPLYRKEKSPVRGRSQSPFDGKKKTKPYDQPQRHHGRSPQRVGADAKFANGHPPYNEEEEEEGLIPAEEEEGMLPADDDGGKLSWKKTEELDIVN